MNTYAVQKAIFESQLQPSFKLVGLALAHHIDRKTGKVRLRQDTLAQMCGVSVPTVKRAVSALIEAGIFTRKITGRSSILTACISGKNTGRVEGSPVSYQIDHGCTFDRLDTTYSTVAEERAKAVGN